MIFEWSLRGGVYKKSAAGNVSPCWVNEENDQAIWWISHLNEWAIGDLSSLGTDIRGITGRNKETDDGIEFGMPWNSNYKDCNKKNVTNIFSRSTMSVDFFFRNKIKFTKLRREKLFLYTNQLIRLIF